MGGCILFYCHPKLKGSVDYHHNVTMYDDPITE